MHQRPRQHLCMVLVIPVAMLRVQLLEQDQQVMAQLFRCLAMAQLLARPPSHMSTLLALATVYNLQQLAGMADLLGHLPPSQHRQHLALTAPRTLAMAHPQRPNQRPKHINGLLLIVNLPCGNLNREEDLKVLLGVAKEPWSLSTKHSKPALGAHVFQWTSEDLRSPWTLQR